jgi:hypothetical protein
MIPSFYGLYDVRHATSEFKDLDNIWWNKLSSICLQPDTWDMLKAAMHDRFVPPSYQRDLHKILQCLDQGYMPVPDYYAE